MLHYLVWRKEGFFILIEYSVICFSCVTTFNLVNNIYAFW